MSENKDNKQPEPVIKRRPPQPQKLQQFNARLSESCQTRIRYISKRLNRTMGDIIEQAISPTSMILGETWQEGDDWCTQIVDSVTKEVVAVVFGPTSSQSKARAQQLIYRIL